MSHAVTTRRRDGQSGFALLMIFVMAAGIAIAMLMQLPRATFESQRDREQSLIDRGEQYKRAIGLFVRKNGRYPAKMEDLENTNNIRYLRKRYVDPMTGKDAWRLVHAGPGGVLTDSLVQKAPVGPDGKPLKNADAMNVDPGNTVGTEAAAPEVNKFVAARPSDRVAGAGQMPGAYNQYDPAQQGSYPPNQNNYGAPSAVPGGAYPPQPGQPGYQQPGTQQFPQPGQQPYPQNQPFPGQQMPQQPGVFPQQQPGYPQQHPVYAPPQPGFQPQQPVYAPPQPGFPQQQPGYPQQQQPVYAPPQPGYPQQQPGYPQQQPGYPQSSYPPGQMGPQPFPAPVGTPNQPGYPPQPGQPQNPQVSQFPQPYQQPGFPQNQPGQFRPGFPPQPGQTGFGPNPQGQQSPGQMIQNMLTQPRPGPAGMMGGAGGQSIGGGIAGVATKYKGPSIKIYGERQKYQEWEFVFDPKTDAAMKARLPGQQQLVNPGNRPQEFPPPQPGPGRQ